MATVERSRSKERPAEKPAEKSAKGRRKKSRAFRWGCWGTLVFLVIGVYFAPLIVAYTPLQGWILRSALPVEGSIALGSMSLDWFSSVAAEKIELRDAAGEILLEVDSVRSEKSLVSLLLDLADLGVLHVDHPTVHVVAQEKETNLERALAPLLHQSPGNPVKLQIEISDGIVIVNDQVVNRELRIENLAVSATLGDLAQGIALVASGTLPAEQPPGSFKIDLHAKATKDHPLAGGKIDCETSNLPLALLQPLLRRPLDKASLSGQATTKLHGAWGEMAEQGNGSVQGETLITEMSLAAAALGTDHIVLARAEIPCRIVQHDDLVEIEQLEINSELANLSLSGSLKTADLSAQNVAQALARETCHVKGQLDLAALARMLPETLRLRAGTEITAGQVSLDVSSEPQASGMTWSGTVHASQLAGQANGRPLRWDNPLSVEFTTHETADGFVVDQAKCDSSFLEVNAAGSLDNLTASANFDLAQLIAHLRQFSDLDHVQLAGQGQAQLTWKRSGADQFSASGEFQAVGFQCSLPGGQDWKEDRLMAQLDLGGRLRQTTIDRVDRAQLTVDIGSEHLQAQLQEAIADLANVNCALRCSWSGQLAHWVPRLETCLGVSGWSVVGLGTCEATLNCSAKAIDVQEAQANFTQFRAVGHGWFVDEPAVSAALAGRYDLATHRLDLAQSRCTAGTATVLVEHAIVQRQGASGWTLDGGTSQFEADLAQCYRWSSDPRRAPNWNVAGRLAGQAQVKLDQGVASGQMNATVDQLQLAALGRNTQPGAPPALWQPQHLTVAALGSYQTSGGQLQFDKLQLASEMLRCDASGTMTIGADGGSVDIKGTLQYDWEQLAPLWRPYLGGGVQVSGQQTREFAVRGPWTGDPTQFQAWQQLTGEAALGWAGMSVYGLTVGQADISAQLAAGQLTTGPFNIPVNEGQLTVAPVVRFTPAPAELRLSRGPLLTNVHLSPEMCARGMKFVMPILAEATVADGRFSMELDGGWLPLANPGAGDVSGRMAMRAQAKPGPLAQQFLSLLQELNTILKKGVLTSLGDQSGALVSIDDSNIEFRMVNGRVYHRGLQFTVGTMPIMTYGSVGLDESIAIIAEIPLQATLFGRDLSFGTLEGQKLQIPIDGTLGKPRLDARVLAQLTGKMLQNTARGVLIDGVGKQLERLLPRQQ